MKTFLQYLLERRWHAGSDAEPLFNKSVNLHQMSDAEKQHQPIWIGHHKKDTRRKYYKNYKPKSHFNKVQIHGKVAHYKDPKIHKLLADHGYDKHEREYYHDHLSQFPTAKTVHNHPITKILQKHGYVGYTHPDIADYDEITHKRTKEKSRVPNTVVFHRKHVTLTQVQHTKNNINPNTIEHLHTTYPKATKGKFAQVNDYKTEKVLMNKGHTENEIAKYNYMIKNPHKTKPKHFHNHPITKTLKKLGYHGALSIDHDYEIHHFAAFNKRHLDRNNEIP